MDAADITAMLAEDRREWAALCATLDAHPDGPLHDQPSPLTPLPEGEGNPPEWTARDVYAHLARWINNSTDGFESWLASRTIPTPPEGDDDTINARWQREDSALTLDEARDRAQRAFDRRIRAIESAPADKWDQILEATAHADDAHHYRAHHGYIRV